MLRSTATDHAAITSRRSTAETAENAEQPSLSDHMCEETARRHASIESTTRNAKTAGNAQQPSLSDHDAITSTRSNVELAATEHLGCASRQHRFMREPRIRRA